MRNVMRTFVLLLLAAATLTSCVSKKKFNELTSEKEDLSTQLSNKKTELAELKDAKAAVEEEYANEKARLEGSVEKIESDLAAAEENLETTQVKLTTAEAEKEKLQSMIDNTFVAYKNSGLQLTAKGGNLMLADFAPVYFRSGSTYVKKENGESLEKLAATLQSNPSLKIMVVGHSDNQTVKPGAAIDNNMRLSYLRAENVAKMLMKKGASSDQIVVSGAGDSQPAVSYTDGNISEARDMNRRVEFLALPNMDGLVTAPASLPETTNETSADAEMKATDEAADLNK